VPARSGTDTGPNVNDLYDSFHWSHNNHIDRNVYRDGTGY
jgi:hypothetical protein